jgi:hypothetical protein
MSSSLFSPAVIGAIVGGVVAAIVVVALLFRKE